MRARSRPDGPLRGRIRLDRRTKDLSRRLRPGEIAVIDHVDLDGPAAYDLAERRPAAVLNAASSISGRYPNGGPMVLIDAGVPLIDACGEALFTSLREGQQAELRGEELWVGGQRVAGGVRLTEGAVRDRMAAARENLAAELLSFSRNTLEHLQREDHLALADLAVPQLAVDLHNRPVLVVVRGEGTRQDLRWVRPYVREQRPILIGVDGGADALLEAGYQPHLIIGDMDSASDEVLRCGAELVLHTYTDGRAGPGKERLLRLGLTAQELPAPGTSEDVAMLLAHQSGASLIVAVGTHFSLVEFLDKRRAGMASTLLTRLRVGSILVDAKGLSRLYRPGLSPSLVAGVILSALIPIVIVVFNSAVVQRWLSILGMSLEVWLRRHGMR